MRFSVIGNYYTETEVEAAGRATVWLTRGRDRATLQEVFADWWRGVPRRSAASLDTATRALPWGSTPPPSGLFRWGGYMDGEAGNRIGVAKHSIVERWGGDAAVLIDGFVAVPRTFLRLAGTLKPSLTPAETLFVIQLMSWKWDERAPFPGYSSVAKRMGVSVPYARKIARSLEKKKLLRRQVRRGQTNRFDLTPLFEKLVDHVGDRSQQS